MEKIKAGKKEERIIFQYSLSALAAIVNFAHCGLNREKLGGLRRWKKTFKKILVARLPLNWKLHLEIQWKKLDFQTKISTEIERSNLITEGEKE